MKKIKAILPYILLLLGAFSVLPLFMSDTASAIMVLLLILPMMVFITSLIYGKRVGFKWIYPLLVMVLFTLSIPIFYNKTAAIYIVLFGLISLMGMFVGSRW